MLNETFSLIFQHCVYVKGLFVGIDLMLSLEA